MPGYEFRAGFWGKNLMLQVGCHGLWWLRCCLFCASGFMVVACLVMFLCLLGLLVVRRRLRCGSGTLGSTFAAGLCSAMSTAQLRLARSRWLAFVCNMVRACLAELRCVALLFGRVASVVMLLLESLYNGRGWWRGARWLGAGCQMSCGACFGAGVMLCKYGIVGSGGLGCWCFGVGSVLVL